MPSRGDFGFKEIEGASRCERVRVRSGTRPPCGVTDRRTHRGAQIEGRHRSVNAQGEDGTDEPSFPDLTPTGY